MRLRKRIVFDCDCTFGVEGCDVDDGLALLYLLGCPEAELMGVTATYGNSRLDTVCESLERLLGDLKREDIPVKRGGASRGEYESEAADFLARTADACPGELSVLATGSLTNLRGAWERDPAFFEKVGEIVLMGGVTEPLVFEKKVMDELNFSCDPEASLTVLAKGRNVSVVTGNNCLKVLFKREEYRKRLLSSKSRTAAYIREKTDYWFRCNEEDYGIGGFYNWDATAAVYLMRSELFSDRREVFALSRSDLAGGYLRRKKGPIQGGQGGEGFAECILNLPQIRKEEAFKEALYGAWLKEE